MASFFAWLLGYGPTAGTLPLVPPMEVLQGAPEYEARVLRILRGHGMGVNNQATGD